MLAHQMVGIRKYEYREMLRFQVNLPHLPDLLYLQSLLYRVGVRLRAAGDWLPRLYRIRVDDPGLLPLRRRQLRDALGGGLLPRAVRLMLFHMTLGWMPVT